MCRKWVTDIYFIEEELGFGSYDFFLTTTYKHRERVCFFKVHFPNPEFVSLRGENED